ncbi:glycosyltransferase family 2 protein [Marinicrinis sediminis]|uniref:Glycosyltransferase family 2 protein n=1 Tax=Marinicrinis sediminis TaxID=1652465 RepID=A0ABW5RDQ3_9BACL
MSVCKLSVVMITKNEQERIAQAIQSCQSIADEIVILDSGSTDQTVTIAGKLGCEVVFHPWEGFAKQRNVGADHAMHDWIFVIDADEWLDETLQQAIKDWKAQPHDPKLVYSVYRIGNFLGSWLHRGERLLRLYHKRHHQFTETPVHEVIDAAKSEIRTLEGVLMHDGFRSIQDHVRRFNMYTDLDARKAHDSKGKFRTHRLLWRPPAKFIQKYVMHKLFMSGLAGLSVSIFWAYYEFLKQLKWYELEWQRKQERRTSLLPPASSVIPSVRKGMEE